MKTIEYFRLAMTNLRQRRVRSWLTLLGIFAGIAAIVALISLGEGLEGAVLEQFGDLGINTLTVVGAGSNFGPPGANAVGEVGIRDVRLIEDNHNVDTAFGRHIFAVRPEFDGIEKGAGAGSIPSNKDRDKILDALNIEVEEGRIINNKDHSKITVGASIDFDDVQPRIGDKITIGERKYSVVGRLEKSGNPFVDNQILMTEDEMEDAFGLSEDDYSMLMVILNDDADNDIVKAELERTLRRDRGQDIGEEDFEISSPQDTIEAFNSILTIVQILLVGIAAISLVVGAIGILNTMYTAVLERRREIGIMKAIGAKNSDINKIFLVESGLLGLAGGIIGFVLGAMISKGVEFGMRAAFGKNLLEAALPGWLIIGSLLFAFALGALSGTLPAQQAAKLKPVDALRK